MLIPQYRTIELKIKKKAFYVILDSAMLIGKNIANTTQFLIKNIYTSFDYDREKSLYLQKENLHTNQIETIKLFNQVINQIDPKRKTAHKKKQVKKINNPPYVPIPSIDKTITTKELMAILTDFSLIDNVVKAKEKQNKVLKNNYTDYTNISSYVASVAVKQTVQNMKNYFKAVIAFWKNVKENKSSNINTSNKKEKLTPPQLPKYLDKNERLTFEIHHQRFNKKGILFKVDAKKHKLYTDFHDKDNSLIDITTINEYNRYNFLEEITTIIEKQINKQSNNKNINTNKINYKLQTVRFVALGKNIELNSRKKLKGKHKEPLKIECVIKIEHEIEDNSTLAKTIHFYNSLKNISNKIEAGNHTTPESTLEKECLKEQLLGKVSINNCDYFELTDKQQAIIAQYVIDCNTIDHFSINLSETIPFNMNKIAKALNEGKDTTDNNSYNNNINSTTNTDFDFNHKDSYKSFNQKIKNNIFINNYNYTCKQNQEQSFTRFGGLDLGIRQIASLALTHGDNILFAGKYINKHLTHLNHQLDSIKTGIFKNYLTKDLFDKVMYNQEVSEINSFEYINNPTLWEQQQKIRQDFIEKHQLNINILETDDNKNNKTTNNTDDKNLKNKLAKKELTKTEQKDLIKASKNIYQNTHYLNTLHKIENFKKQTLHQLSHDIIQNCINSQTQVLIIGKNLGQKQKTNMGKSNNRLFMTLPHARLIELIQYKAIQYGILVVLTEESYTSQSSFIHHDILPSYNKNNDKTHINKEKDVENKKVKELNKDTKNQDEEKLHQKRNSSSNIKNNETNMEADNNQSHENVVVKQIKTKDKNGSQSFSFSGVRKSNSFIFNKDKKTPITIHNQTLKEIHSDINGSFNMIRKVVKSFCYTPKIKLDYQLVGINNKGKSSFSPCYLKPKPLHINNIL